MKQLPHDLDATSLNGCYNSVTTLLAMATRGNRGLFINQLISLCC